MIGILADGYAGWESVEFEILWGLCYAVGVKCAVWSVYIIYHSNMCKEALL